MKKAIRIGILDDHVGLSQVLAESLGNAEDMEVPLIAENEAALQINLAKRAVDVLLLDLNLKNEDGMDLLPSLIEQFPEMKIMVYSFHNEEHIMALAIQQGAHGYLCKTCDLKEIKEGIRTLVSKGSYFTHEVSLALSRRMKHLHLTAHRSGPLGRFNRLELECYRHLLADRTVLDTAERMNKSKSMVKTYRKSLRKKSKCVTLSGLIRWGQEHGLEPAE